MSSVRRISPAFSLIELLVVISIVAILVGILLPTLHAARNYAVKTACSSNLRQIGMGIQMYADAWKEVYPTARYMPPPFVSGDSDPPLMTVVDPYLQGGRVWECPGDSYQVYKLSGTSYQYESLVSGQKMDEFFPVKIFKISLSQVVVSRDFDNGLFDVESGTLEVGPFHDLRNLLFADGHVGNF